jgi:hypothetical protein
MDIETEDFLNQAVGVEEAVAGDPVAEAAPPAQAEAPSPAREPERVPLGTLLDERERRQKAERERDELRAARQRETPPDPAEAAEARRHADNLRFSRKFAEREYGRDVIATVHDWAAAKCDADPFFNASMRSSEDPYEAAWQAYNREQIAAKVSPERLAQFEAWEKAQAEAQGQQTQTPQPSAPTPPRSLAEAPGTGLSATAAGLKSSEQVFADLFP